MTFQRDARDLYSVLAPIARRLAVTLALVVAFSAGAAEPAMPRVIPCPQVELYGSGWAMLCARNAALQIGGKGECPAATSAAWWPITSAP